ncbi:phospholipase D-like domain-containing protein [Thiohalobacter sp. IOR34]|uniref:phospholipase D-like domain-containing protein n=1 Tax=Thiohalobacter sp. IOR34 TaxID=3057176 RepID=UPI0025B08A9D|nr:phospholipase D-like domain-containing protein [Thiohalobacter sp. IOR34]WJW75236.1 phospholipase D-like domain-containing protein [Thiohalobacter sp. IOR34]
MPSTPSSPSFPWRRGNRFRLLADGDRFFPVMLEAIDSARDSILLEIYLFESGQTAGRFVEALSRAAGRGLQVCLLLDDFGARGLAQADRQRLTEAGVALAFHNPLHYGDLRRNLFRDHRKLLIVDGCLAFTGGFGITDEFDPASDPRPWRETVVEIRGPVLQDWHRLFARNWQRWDERPLPALPRPAPDPADMPGRTVISIDMHRAEIKRSLHYHCRHARQHIWIATAYFVPSRKLRQALKRAARRGVDVRLLLPGRYTDHPAVRLAGRRFYSQLLDAGVRIFEYQPRFLHQKVAVCDDWVSIGSSNLDRWNLRWNLEANQEIRHPAFTAEVMRMLEQDVADSEEIRRRPWHQRPWYNRLGERLFGAIDRWVDRFLQRRRH